MPDADGRGGWVSYTNAPGGMDHLAPEVRAEIERQTALRSERRGRLLCEVHVQVYERGTADDAGMFVSFPAAAGLGPDSDPADIAGAVARAREILASWQ